MPSKRDRIRQARRTTLIWLTVLVLTAATSPLWGGVAARTIAQHLAGWSNPLRVEQIEVSGTRELCADSISAWANIPRHIPLFAVSPAVVSERLKRHPWIRRADVRRRFPRMIQIVIEERVPLVVIRESNLVAVSEDAVVLPPLRPDWIWDLPILTPPRTPKMTVGQTVVDPVVLSLLRETRRLKSISRPAWENLSEIYFGGGRMRAVLSQPPVELILCEGVGELSWIAALQFVHQASVQLTHQTLDIRFPGRIVVAEQPSTLEHGAG